MKNIAAVFHQQPGEKVIMVLRRHPIVFLTDLAVILVLLAVPFAGWFIIRIFWPTVLGGLVSRPVLLLVASAYLLFTWLFLIEQFIEYYLDIWVVTDRKILDINQINLWSRTVAEVELDKVQDVTSEVKGILPSLLDYGNVYVQTAGETERFVFKQVRHPEKIRDAVLQVVEKHVDKKPNP
jgi:hypothetical protein